MSISTEDKKVNGKGSKKGSTKKASLKMKKEPSLEDLLYRAWKKTYENHHNRLD